MTCAVRADSLPGPATFGDALARARSHSRLSQLELALRAGTTQRHVSFLERGRSVPGRGLVIRLAEALGLSLDDDAPVAQRPGYLGLAMPLQLASRAGNLTLLTTVTSFSTAADVTVAELRLEAFLPADADTAARLEALAELRRS